MQELELVESKVTWGEGDPKKGITISRITKSVGRRILSKIS